jgi:Zn-dependent peptidase ImmA (M78 family)/transcriptional regulator with XRE-family HTH domain
MAKAVPLQGVQPAMLKWARESVHMSIDEVASKFGNDPDNVLAWEAGTNAPSYAQLEKLAYDYYKRPLALFFMPAPPKEPNPEVEFRALPDADLKALSRDTVLLIRRAHAYQASLIELFGSQSPSQAPIWQRVGLDASKPVQQQALDIRKALGVPEVGANAWGAADGDKALKLWRKAIEASGIFVFKDSFKQKELSGFCLEHPQLPVVMINNSTTKTRQIFSLLHELAHILLGRNAISTFNDEPIRRLQPNEQKIERFCNAIAAGILVPSDDFERQVSNLARDIESWSSDQFGVVAERYRVSREVILRIFRDKGRVTQEFYSERKEEWDGQRAGSNKPGGSYYLTKGAYLSERLMTEVFSRYGKRQITVDEAADYINVKAKQIDEFESRFLQGLAA